MLVAPCAPGRPRCAADGVACVACVTQRIARFAASAEQAFGPPAVMIANAGIVPNASVLSMDVSTWDACRHRDEPSGRLFVLPSRRAEHGRARDPRSDRHHLIHRAQLWAVGCVRLLRVE